MEETCFVGDKKNSDKETSAQDEKISEYGQAVLDKNKEKVKIHLLTIIGEIEGHENSPGNVKTTKYEHVLPQLAAIEDDDSIQGVLVLLNTVGGDVSCGLALAEMIASIGKPKVSLVIGDTHSIGVPLATAADYAFIVPSGTMLIHPVRMSGMVIGAPQTYEFFQRIQDRITGFISSHSSVSKERLEQMMMETEQMTKDLGTLLVGQDAVEEGLVNEVGGISQAMRKLYELIGV
ncbi:MAG: ClpP family protease [Lachnospiraceae bacterium]